MVKRILSNRINIVDNNYKNDTGQGCVVVIPVYKQLMSEFETLSFRQCCKILSPHPICLVTYSDLDCSTYYTIASEFGVILQRQNFRSYYFDNIEGYNKLLLSYKFYNRFKDYQYMLIYQLDAYVFRDELSNWCSLNYDYIGAPWGKGFNKLDIKEMNDWMVGNGGFSLRRIHSFISILSHRNVLSLKQIVGLSTSRKNRLIYIAAKYLGYKNTFTYHFRKCHSGEDVFFCYTLANLGIRLSTPKPEIAIRFSFESEPELLYAVSNSNLPFGCHAWYSYGRLSFWRKYIDYEKNH